jgi:cytochrome c553
MKDRGVRNLAILVISVGVGLFSFYGFIGYRTRLWSPRWAISPTKKAYPVVNINPGTSQPEADSPVERGRLLYQELRCGVCHGPNGEGGVKNPNSDPDGTVPNLFDLADAFTWNDLKDKLLKGAHSAKLEEDKPEPPLEMPSWEKVLSDQEMEELTHYLFSLKSPTETAETDDLSAVPAQADQSEVVKKKNWDWNGLETMTLLMSEIGTIWKSKNQPVPFSHKAHVNFGMACDSCHLGAKDSVKTTIPNVQTCAFCHIPDKKMPRTPKSLGEYIREMKEIPWEKVYQSPPHVRFSHQRHVEMAGLECKSCHGDIANEEKALVRQLVPLNMGSCLGCHKVEKVTTDCLACHR